MVASRRKIIEEREIEDKETLRTVALKCFRSTIDASSLQKRLLKRGYKVHISACVAVLILLKKEGILKTSGSSYKKIV